MTDDRTSHLDLPLPHPENLLQEDVMRLRSAISAIDSQFAALDLLLQSIEALQQVEETHVLTEGQTVIDLAVLTGTAGATVYVEGVRLKASDWTPHGTIMTRLTLGKTYPAGHEVTVVRQQGGV